MENIQAVLCLDIDGTLIDEQEKIHPEDIKILNCFPNTIQPILTTGRPLGSARRVIQANFVFQDHPLPLPGVFMNGTAAYLPGEELILEHNFPKSVLQDLIYLSEIFRESSFAFFTLDNIHIVNPNNFSLDISKLHHLSIMESKNSNPPTKINKMMVIEKDSDILHKIKKQADGIMAEIAYSLPFLLEFTPKGINKSKTIHPLLSALSIEGKPIYAVGDGQNDLGLFNLAEKSFAPSSAPIEILDRADRIIHKEKDGILNPIIKTIVESI